MLGLGLGDPSAPPAPARDAATVVLLRPCAAGPFEVLLLRRTGRAGFLANALVFPGGRVDAADAEPEVIDRLDLTADPRALEPARLGEAPERADAARALWVAALRETFEESGVLLGMSRTVDAAALDAARDALNRGEVTFAQALERLSARVDPTRLRYVARWITPVVEPKRFDTRFFMARVEADQTARPDERETTQSLWVTPARAVADADAGEAPLAPPTYRVLLTLARCDTIGAALALRDGLPPVIAPRFDTTATTLTLLLPGDAAFDGADGRADERGTARNRITLVDGRWRSEGEGF